MRPVLRALLLLVLILGAGCGETREVRESDLVVPGQPAAGPDIGGEERSDGAIRVAVVTHGQASSEFWAKVRAGMSAAARQMEVSVSYRAPDVYSLPRMQELIDEAVDERPDGLVVSVPDPAIYRSIRGAVDLGIPVVSINSGSDLLRRLGTLAHVGQPEHEAGLRAGERLATGVVRRAICINHEPGNVGLEQRCAGFARAMQRVGAEVREVQVDFNDTEKAERALGEAVARIRPDRVLALNSQATVAAVAAVRSAGLDDARIGAFDLTPEVLQAVERGTVDFTIDQQPYLQGYLPVIMLAELARHGLFPAQGKVIPTGPHFVTRETAAEALRLSEIGIR